MYPYKYTSAWFLEANVKPTFARACMCLASYSCLRGQKAMSKLERGLWFYSAVAPSDVCSSTDALLPFAVKKSPCCGVMEAWWTIVAQDAPLSQSHTIPPIARYHPNPKRCDTSSLSNTGLRNLPISLPTEKICMPKFF